MKPSIKVRPSTISETLWRTALKLADGDEADAMALLIGALAIGIALGSPEAVPRRLDVIAEELPEGVAMFQRVRADREAAAVVNVFRDARAQRDGKQGEPS